MITIRKHIFKTLLFLTAFLLTASSCSTNRRLERKAATFDEGVVINGVKWATRNVDAPGTFTKNPEDAGKFYLWNRNIGWSATNPMVNSNGSTEWDNTMPKGTEWEKTNDPSPVGWRVPTFVELQSLLDTEEVKREWITENGINGSRFTDKTSGSSIFFPAVGWREGYNGELFSPDSSYYWSSTQGVSSSAWGLGISSTVFKINSTRVSGYSVRSVAE